MKFRQQILSWYLVLCVLFAGAVGISPRLHLWFEHDGHGVAHTHSHGGGLAAAKHPHPHPRGFVHSASAPAKVAPPARLVVDDHSPALFGLKLIDVYRIAGQWLAQAAEHLPAEQPNDAPGHTHHSLAQMLGGGAVEVLGDVPPLVCEPTAFTLSFAEISVLALEKGFNPQTASRAPPVFS